MPRERDPPYVAAGFRTDAQNLLDRFVAKKTLKFADFAEIWRELHFSTIFMGREGLRELTEFLEECYRNTLLFMDASNPYQKVGAIYLLYSLYMKQPPYLLNSQIPVRISYKQVWEIYNLENHFLDVSTDSGVMDLTYIITKLFKMEAFSISCLPIPMGPAVPIPLFRLEPLRNSPFKEMLSVLTMLNENDIKVIDLLSKGLEERKKQIPFSWINTSKETGCFNKYEEVKEMINELEQRYNAGLFPNKEQGLERTKISQEKHEPQLSVSGDMKIEEELRTLGQRRALLKSQQYERVAEFRKSKTTCTSGSSGSESPVPVKRGPGRPKLKRDKRGRKKRVVENVKCAVETEVKDAEVVTEAIEGDEAQAEAEIVDNPEEILNSRPAFPYRRPSKYPRPVRRFYFQNEESEAEDS